MFRLCSGNHTGSDKYRLDNRRQGRGDSGKISHRTRRVKTPSCYSQILPVFLRTADTTVVSSYIVNVVLMREETIPFIRCPLRKLHSRVSP